MIPVGILAASSGASPAPSAWEPADLSVPLRVWLDDGSNVDIVGGLAAQWSDRSGQGWHFLQTTSSQRPLVMPGELNGRRALRFDGITDMLVVGSPEGRDIFKAASAGWSFTVYRKRAQGTAAGGACVFYVHAGATPAQSNRFNVLAERASTPGLGAFATRRELSDATAVIARSSSDVGAWVMRMDAVSWTDGVARLYVNGKLDAEDSSTLTAGLTSDLTPPSISLGGSAVATNSYADIDLAAVLVGNGELPSGEEIDKLFGWAAHRFGLIESLPVDHPYRDAPP